MHLNLKRLMNHFGLNAFGVRAPLMGPIQQETQSEHIFHGLDASEPPEKRQIDADQQRLRMFLVI